MTANTGPGLAPVGNDASPVARGSAEAVRTGPRALVWVLLLAATVYVDCVGYQFVWDDWAMVAQNQRVRGFGHLPELLGDDFTALTHGTVGGRYYRPVLALSLAMDAALAGPNPAIFHLVNILLHLLATFLVSRLVLAMGGGRDVAVLAALLFAVHPVHVEAVAFVSARGDLLLTIAVLGCLLAHRRSGMPGPRQIAWRGAALALQALALLTKEPAVTLPALLILSDALAPAPSGSTKAGPAWRRALTRSLPFWAAVAIFAAFRFSQLQHIAGGNFQVGDLWRRLPGSLEILARYAALSLFPTHMQPYYSLPRPASLLDPWPMLGLCVAALLISLVMWFWRRAPLAAFAVGWFLITVVPVVDLIPLSFREMGLADRYLYLPSVGVAGLLAVGIVTLMGPVADAPWRPRRLAAWVGVTSLVAVCAWSLLSYLPVWRNNLTLYARMERVAPRSPIPSFNLGMTYFRANDVPRATAAVERAVRLNPGLPRPREILALLYVLQGRASEGFRLFDGLASEGPLGRDYYVARTMAHLFAGQAREALAIAEDGEPRFPDDPDLAEWLGRALERAGRTAEAMEKYRRALSLAPDLFQVQEALGYLLAQSGRPAEATQHFLRSAEIQPDRAQPLRALALLAEEQGHSAESLRLWRQVLERAPNGVAVREAATQIRRLERERTAPAGAPPHGTPSGATKS